MIGNFIADFVKGNKKNDYPQRIRRGIELHRQIDFYTDQHPVTAESKNRLYPKHHKYAGVIVDLFYDHFLAKNFKLYSEKSLKEFAAATYETITSYHAILPENVRAFLPYMIEYDWLSNYATIEGIGRSLAGLGRRVAFRNRMDEAVFDLEENYAEFEGEFRRFFPQLITFALLKRE